MEEEETPEKEKPLLGKEEENTTHNKTLKKIFFILVAFSLLIVIGIMFINSTRHFEYRGITGNVIKEGEIVFYHTSIPIMYEGEVVPYNFYMRNNPKKLEFIPFDGNLELLENVVLNSTEDFNCDGKGTISIVNLKNLYEIIGSKVIKDDTALCDPEGRYMFLNLQHGDETSIEQVGPGCYNLNINNCEILEVTEKFMFETLIKVNEIIKERESELAS